MKPLIVVAIVGARPQFIKAAPVSRALREAGHQEFLLHTGQHYDYEMSRVFFGELGIQEPNINLEVGSGLHGRQTGEMLLRIEEVLLEQKPDCVLVYGDTNSTLAGALAACKLRICLSHVEAGLRSFNREMPEEHNRVLTDHISDMLLCPTKRAVVNLEREGITRNVHLVGDVMYDSVLHNLKLAEKRSQILEKLALKQKDYVLATVHRAENTENTEKLKSIFQTLEKIASDGLSVIVPLHPRTRNKLDSLRLPLSNLQLIKPVSYLEMLLLQKQAKVIVTDSGGMQKEAYWLRIPCVTLRDETEWAETVESGWNMLVGSESNRILRAVKDAHPGSSLEDVYSDGKAAEKIVQLISSL
jgi:UDP-N-acetylglucosamine 2-epimerase